MKRQTRAWVGLGLLLVLGLAACALFAGLSSLPHMPVNLIIDGEEVFTGLELHSLNAGQRLGLALGLLLALTLVMLVVPLTLIMVAAVVVMSLIAGLGIPLLVMAIVLALLLSPLLLLGLLIRWAVRRQPPRSATMVG